MSTTTTNFGFIKPDLTDPADITAMNSNWEKIDNALVNSGIPILNVTLEHETSGVYIATCEGLTIKNGSKITIIPDRPILDYAMPSLSLKLNGIYYDIERRVDNVINSLATAKDIVFNPNFAYTLTYYDDTESFLLEGYENPTASDLLGLVPIEKGGTGSATATGALKKLGGAPAYTYGTTDLTAGTSTLETGKLYFVYE